MTDFNPPADDPDDRNLPDYSVGFDPATDRVPAVLIDGVASARGVDPLELTPLSSAVDPDALESLLDNPAEDMRRNDLVCVAFAYEGYHVVVTNAGTITLRRTDD